jgi:hypothetical protein
MYTLKQQIDADENLASLRRRCPTASVESFESVLYTYLLPAFCRGRDKVVENRLAGFSCYEATACARNLFQN